MGVIVAPVVPDDVPWAGDAAEEGGRPLILMILILMRKK
jgi:hypothetical protein